MEILYALAIIVVLALIFPFMDWIMRGVIFALLAIYLIFFSGFSGYIRPFFDDMSGWSYSWGAQDYRFGGTGVAISPHFLLTNFHVIERCDNLAVRTVNNEIFHVDVASSLERTVLPIFSHPVKDGHDLSVLYSKKPLPHFALLDNEMPKKGDVLLSPDYDTEPGTFKRRKGKVLRLENQRISFSGMGRKGNSGSPVYNEKGYLVGIQWGGGASMLGMNNNVAASFDVVKAWLEQLKIPIAKVESYDQEIVNSEWFEQSYAVGILCNVNRDAL
ncbi:MAG: serine protease [Rickettsiales bacterium]|nr:serine protease [Rickettsiales bacterium]